MTHQNLNDSLPPQTVDNMRALNRIVTQASGVVNRTVLGSDMSLTEMRILYELGLSAQTARTLSQRLQIDEGYLSRILKRFAERGWLLRTPSPEDGRVAELSLTDAGTQLRAGYEDKARGQVRQSLSEVAAAERPSLDRAIARLRMSLSDPTVAGSPVTYRDMEIGDLGWLVQRHAELYLIEHQYDQSFETLVAEILLEFIKTRDPARERAIIPMRDGMGLGSVFCVQGKEPDTAQLRLFWLEPAVRGQGLAQNMLDAWLDFARSAGYRQAMLWTHEAHAAAGRLYARNGFQITGTKPTRNFGQDVVEQCWERAL